MCNHFTAYLNFASCNIPMNGQMNQPQKCRPVIQLGEYFLINNLCDVNR